MPVKLTVRGPALGEVVRLLIGSRVGRSFTGLTVSRKLVLIVAPSGSATVSVMVSEPNWLVNGASVTVRLAVTPERTILSLEIRLGFDEVAVTVKLVAALSTMA